MAAEVPKTQPKSEDGVFSLEDLDKLIEQEDPNFKNEMAGIKAAGGEIKADIETLDIEGEEQEVSTEPDEKNFKEKIRDFLLGPWRRAHAWFKMRWIAFKNRMILLLDQTHTFVRYELPERLRYWKTQSMNFGRSVVVRLKQFWTAFRSMTSKEKLGLFFMLMASALSLYFLSRTFTGSWLPHFSDSLVRSLEKGAGFVGSFKEKDELQDFFEAFPEVEYQVLLDKVIVNLRPDSESGRNPMGVYQFYFGVDSQDTAIEVKDREREILDVVQRELESFTYSEATTKIGKIRMKAAMRDRVNEILNQGHVFHIYISTFVTSP